MKDLTALVVIGAILLILIFYFVTAKGEKKKIQMINSEGKKISVNVEIADNITTRAKGLMGRSSLGKNEGMLFLFENEATHSFWMLNTTIPLDAIHFSENGTVVDIIQMDPCKIVCKSYLPTAKSKYVLEVNQNFSKENKIKVGDKLILNSVS